MEQLDAVDPRSEVVAPYRISFALMTIAGNISRLNTTRPLVEADPTVASEWHPIDTWRPHDWVHVFPGMGKVWARHLLDSRRVLLGTAPDALVVHAFETYGLYALRKRLLGTSTVLIYNPDSPIDSRFNGLAFSQTDLFVPWSEDCRAGLEARSSLVHEGNTRVLHPGIDLTEWSYSPEREPTGGRRFQLLFVGGDFRRKGGTALIDAFESGLADTCDLTIVTQEPYVPETDLARMRRHPQIDLRLDVAPGSGDSRVLFQTADALLLPTRAEGIPWVLIEAMASGTPVISTAVNGIPDLVDDGATGLVVGVDEPRSIVAAVDHLRNDPGLRSNLATRARRHVEESFDAARNTAKLLRWAKELVDERQAGQISR